jgi:hypothetical protein
VDDISKTMIFQRGFLIKLSGASKKVFLRWKVNQHTHQLEELPSFPLIKVPSSANNTTGVTKYFSAVWRRVDTYRVVVALHAYTHGGGYNDMQRHYIFYLIDLVDGLPVTPLWFTDPPTTSRQKFPKLVMHDRCAVLYSIASTWGDTMGVDTIVKWVKRDLLTGAVISTGTSTSYEKSFSTHRLVVAHGSRRLIHALTGPIIRSNSLLESGSITEKVTIPELDNFEVATLTTTMFPGEIILHGVARDRSEPSRSILWIRSV